MLENARRRWPAVDFEVAHATMQGTRCAGEVMEALERLDRHPDVDVVVVARGGGSVEDLLPFSDEALVRTVHRMSTPVVSAIGHEQDAPLLDLVADVRASTPTDAAKLVVPDVVEEIEGVARARDRLRSLVAAQVAREQAGLDALRSRPALADPRSLVDARGRRAGGCCASGPGARCRTASTGPPTRSTTSAPGPARSRRWPRCAAATPCSRTPTATSSPPSTGSPPAPRSACGSPTAASTPPPPGSSRCSSPRPPRTQRTSTDG